MQAREQHLQFPTEMTGSQVEPTTCSREAPVEHLPRFGDGKPELFQQILHVEVDAIRLDPVCAPENSGSATD